VHSPCPPSFVVGRLTMAPRMLPAVAVVVALAASFAASASGFRTLDNLPGATLFHSANDSHRSGRHAAALGQYKAVARWANKRAHHNIGVHYARGLGTARDLPRSWAWFQLSAERGYAVFPIRVTFKPDDSKSVTPLTRWREDPNGSSTDPDTIRGYQWADATHAGIDCGKSGIVVVDLDVNQLRFMDGERVLWSAPVGTGTGLQLRSKDGEWDFSTPTGVFLVVGRFGSRRRLLLLRWHRFELPIGGRRR
jgi:hypothetical protein